MAFASGKNAYGISDRSGFRYRLRDMKTEWNGLKVGPDEYEEKHPQLEPRRTVIDPQALRDPRPDTNNIIPAKVTFPSFNTETLRFIDPVFMRGRVGTVTFSDDVVTPTGVSVTLTGISATISLNSIVTPNATVNLTGVSATTSVGSVGVSIDGGVAQIFTVTVVSTGYGNKYYIDGVQQATVTLSEGSTYRFDQSDSSNSGHPLRFSTTSNGTHAGGLEYTTGVSTSGTPGSSGAYTQITVDSGAPTLYYYCTNHSGMGGQANTP